MTKKKPNKAEREYFSRVVEMGCFICHAPAEIHHKTGQGMGLRASNKDVMPLCPRHHRLGDYGYCVHNGTKTFEKNYHTQDYMIEKTKERLGCLRK